MIWQEAIRNASHILSEAGISDAQTNAEYLAAHILGLWNKVDVRSFSHAILTTEQTSEYEQLIVRRKRGEPLQHLTGETEFFGLRFLCSPSALIPRPDTEILVEEALKEAAKLSEKNSRILDVGTGSGIIALTLASRLRDSHIIGIDISNNALALAEKNLARLEISNVQFEEIDIFDPEMESRFSRSIDLLISNPPYISTEEFELLDAEVRNFDPRLALTDESDGLRFYRRIAELAPTLLNPGGKVLVEVGFDSSGKVKEIFKTLGFNIDRIVKDLQGIERVVVVSI